MKTIHMTIKCNACEKHYHITVDHDGYVAWKNEKGLIQDLLPNNSSDERELLISGNCGSCYDKTFYYK